MQNKTRLWACAAVVAIAAGALGISTSANAATTAGCATPWVAGSTHVGGDTVSLSGKNYTANWWTQSDPSRTNGVSGSGQPWAPGIACSGAVIPTPTPTKTSAPTPTPTPTATTAPTTTPGTTGSAAPVIFSPYKYSGEGQDWEKFKLQSAASGTLLPLVGPGSLVSQITGLTTLTLAFATGECGAESWNGVSAANFASANIPDFDAAGVNYIVSTGGAGGVFTCSTKAGMDAFIDRYSSKHLVGIDFDIEAGQSAADIQSLVALAAYEQPRHPGLRFSFTLASLGSSDGSFGSVNSSGDDAMKAIAATPSLTHYTVNLMTMDYGDTAPGVCVVTTGQCDMGRTAVQAVTNLEHTYGTPASRIEITQMIGVNDSTSETTTLADIDTTVAYVKSAGLAGFHFWSLDRDRPSSASFVASDGSSLPNVPALSFTRRALADLG
ncbi:MAG: carbohydrate-binding protein [Microbacteriaceae bacterium]|nr:carbohydrate-binding protein [Microbacteriaceae bacterium]